LSVPERDRLFGTFLIDCARSYLLLRIETDVIQGAVALLRVYPLRTADAIQLSTAVQLNQTLQEAQLGPVIMASADDRLLQAAASESLSIVNPNL
jgi:predicted nucleic acid-binding protein